MKRLCFGAVNHAPNSSVIFTAQRRAQLKAPAARWTGGCQVTILSFICAMVCSCRSSWRRPAAADVAAAAVCHYKCPPVAASRIQTGSGELSADPGGHGALASALSSRMRLLGRSLSRPFGPYQYLTIEDGEAPRAVLRGLGLYIVQLSSENLCRVLRLVTTPYSSLRKPTLAMMNILVSAWLIFSHGYNERVLSWSRSFN